MNQQKLAYITSKAELVIDIYSIQMNVIIKTVLHVTTGYKGEK